MRKGAPVTRGQARRQLTFTREPPSLCPGPWATEAGSGPPPRSARSGTGSRGRDCAPGRALARSFGSGQREWTP